MSALEQLVLDLDAPTVAAPALSRHTPAGAPRLLRKLLSNGMDPAALEAAAALVAALDEQGAS